MSIKKLNPKILIVEDHADTYRNLKNFFTDSGCEVAMRKDGAIVDTFEKALEVLDQQAPDIALLDIEIKGNKDGLSLGQHIAECYKIPVVFLTGKDTLENRLIADRFAHLPIIEKISKNIPNEVLLKSISFIWTRILLATPPAQSMELRAVEMKVDMENFDIAEVVGDAYPVKTTLDCSRIYFISSFNDKRNSNLIHVRGSKAYRTRNTMDQLVALLGADFKRISKYATVNLQAILHYSERKKTCMVKNYTLKIGKHYWDDFSAEMHRRQKPRDD